MSTCIRKPEDAVAVLRASGIDGTNDETAVICLGPDGDVQMVLAVEGRRVGGWVSALEKVLVQALPGHAASVVFASCRPDGAVTVSSSDRRAWNRLSNALEAVGVAAFDYLIVAGSRWRSLANGGAD